MKLVVAFIKASFTLSTYFVIHLTGFQKYHQNSILDCQFPENVGDGFCHDRTNNYHCAFDRGDCCGSSCVNTDYCKKCKCKTGIIKGIMNPLVGDKYCHDHTNNAECNFDGGDCCGPCVNKEKCFNCTCIGGPMPIGINNAIVGDGVCNDETNTANCMFDDFDCCESIGMNLEKKIINVSCKIKLIIIFRIPC